MSESSQETERISPLRHPCPACGELNGSLVPSPIPTGDGANLVCRKCHRALSAMRILTPEARANLANHIIAAESPVVTEGSGEAAEA